MKIFAPFVLLTLLIDKLFAFWYSETFSGEIQTLFFYVVIGMWAYVRAHVANKAFKLSMPTVMFSAVMLLTVLLCSAKAILVGTVIISMEYQSTPAWLASLYYWSYDNFENAAIALSIMELFSLLTLRIKFNGAGGWISNAISSFYAVPRIDQTKGIKV